jgi:hypothetical protein
VHIVAKLPKWIWVLLGGIGVIAATSLTAHLLLARECFPRALWSTIELGLGLIVLIVAQAWALTVIAPDDDKLGPKDVFFSTRLWLLTFRRLPETRRQVWMGGWATAAIACAVFLVGGFSYWYQYYKPKKIVQKNLISAAAGLAKGKEKAASLTEAVEALADSQDLTKKDPKADAEKSKEDRRPTVQCAVIGYLVEGDDFAGLALATLDSDRMKYAGVVTRGFSPEVGKELWDRLKKLEQPNPVFPNLRLSAIWVRPEVFVEVHQSGWDKEGLLLNPNFSSLLADK